jgi:hypothetical protein
MEASLRTLETESTAPIMESFLIGLNASDLESKLESKMRRLLTKYRDRKAKDQMRKKEWESVNAERPNPEADHPTDIKMIEEAKQTIGDYKLKSDAKYEAVEEQRETVIKKLQEIIKTREDAFNIRNDYNQKIFALRDKKKELIHYVKRKMRKLTEIHEEIPEAQRIMPEFNVTFDFNREFPERNFDLHQYLSPESYDEKLMEVPSSRDVTKAPKNAHLIELQREILKPNTQPHSFKGYKIGDKVNKNLLKKLQECVDESSEWEIEMTNLRTRRRIFEQEKIIGKVKARIVAFDEEIAQLCDERYDVEVKAKFKEIFLLTLNQELMILKDFESIEDALMDDVECKEVEKKQLLFRISNANAEIELVKRTIEELQDVCKKIEHRFKSACSESKFFSFLRKIFYHHRLHSISTSSALLSTNAINDERSSSSNSSATSSDEKDLKVQKHFDERTCPKGCDRKLYELAFELRNERHEHERTINAKQKELEAILLDVEVLNQKHEKSKHDYERFKTKLSEVRRHKQQLLNDVDTIVILKMDQMQYFKNHDEFVDIDNTLLFNSHNVTRLYSRVGKLALETIEAKRSHRINVIHLAKMKTDIKFMEKQIIDLKDDVNAAMMKKFGRVIDLNEVEETILKRFAFEMQIEIRANADDIKRQYFNKINELKVLF